VTSTQASTLQSLLGTRYSEADDKSAEYQGIQGCAGVRGVDEALAFLPSSFTLRSSHPRVSCSSQCYRLTISLLPSGRECMNYTAETWRGLGEVGGTVAWNLKKLDFSHKTGGASLRSSVFGV
jgi:hypothetical protein